MRKGLVELLCCNGDERIYALVEYQYLSIIERSFKQSWGEPRVDMEMQGAENC